MKALRSLLACFIPCCALALFGCASDDSMASDPPPLEVPAGCNPLAFEHDCLLPYPSDFFLVTDSTMPSGKRVVIPDAAKPKTRQGDSIDFTIAHPVDGFSHHQPILVYFSKGVSTDGVIFHTDDPQKSLQPDSKVLLIDAVSGEPVPVWAEVDLNTSEPAEQAFIIRPFVRLENSRRYIVALQGLTEGKRDGDTDPKPLLDAPAGFMRIRDHQAYSDPVLGPIASRYEVAVFPAITALGVDRHALQLAWDFTTSSEKSNTGDMLDIRADLLPKLMAQPPVVTITNVIEKTVDEDSDIWLRVEGTIRVPLYLESTDVGAALHRDTSGKVAQNGEAEVPFTLQVPQSANPTDPSFTPARILEYGHGFFGSREEINYSFMRAYSNEQHYVTVAVDWWGMSEPDLDAVMQSATTHPNDIFNFVDRLHQAMVNMIALSYAVKGPLADVAQLKVSSKLLYDPAQLYYYGISQGAIFGFTMLSLNPILDRAALSAGGGPYSLMMSRSGTFGDLYNLLVLQLPDPLTAMKFIGMGQSTWDRVDPMTYAPHLLQHAYAGSPANRHLLMQIGIGDDEVNNLASHLVSRAANLPLITPSSQDVWGLTPVTPPTDDGLEILDFHLASVPGIYCRIPDPSEDNDVHEGIRRDPKMKAQLDRFFQPDGLIEDTCAGPCSP